MSIKDVKTLAARFLLGFVLVTIGFSLGRHTAGRPVPDHGPDKDALAAGRKVVVYSAHMTFRCPECNQIEWLTSELINTEFAAELESGELEFRTIDYMRDIVFAGKYDVSSSTVIVVLFRDGEEIKFERLDQVWTKVRNRQDFMDYVRSAVVSALQEE